MGDNLALAWARAFIDSSYAEVANGVMPEIEFVEGSTTRELLASLLRETIDILILIDHAPFVGESMPSELSSGDIIRREAQRAIVGLEIGRRALRTMVLSHGDVAGWSTMLSGLGFMSSRPAFSDQELLSAPRNASVSSLNSPLVTSYLQPLFDAGAVAFDRSLCLEWPREAFFYGDVPGEIMPTTVEVAGRARILAYGPYLPLPSGSWYATAFLGFSHDIGKLAFILEVETGNTVSRGFFEVEHGGIFTLKLDFRIIDALYPVEVRLISQDSALEGQLSLISVELKRNGDNENIWTV